LSAAFAPAYVDVVLGTPYDNGDAEFKYHLETASDCQNQGAANRGIGESAAYWSAYIQAAYEGPESKDNDPDTEDGRLGTTYIVEPEYSFVFVEVLRDLCEDEDRNGQQVHQRTVLHEIGHQFELPHAHWGVMIDNLDLQISEFTEVSVKAIREIDHP
jgi:hypothetical protein